MLHSIIPQYAMRQGLYLRNAFLYQLRLTVCTRWNRCMRCRAPMTGAGYRVQGKRAHCFKYMGAPTNPGPSPNAPSRTRRTQWYVVSSRLCAHQQIAASHAKREARHLWLCGV